MEVRNGYYLVSYSDFDSFKEDLLSSGKMTRLARIALSSLKRDDVFVWSRGENFGNMKYRERYCALFRLRGVRRFSFTDCQIAIENPLQYITRWSFTDYITKYKRSKDEFAR